MNLRRQAIDRECQIRLDGCTGGPCCLAHWRQIGISGLGMKSPDWLGAWACDACHTKVDSTRRGDIDTQLDFARGVFRTLATLYREGKLEVTT
jgi:hypothetical protein